MSLGRGDLPLAGQARTLRVVVAVATSADCETLAALADVARNEKATQRGGATLLATRFPEPPDAAMFRRALASDRRRFWVANLDGASVGFAAAHLQTLANGTLLADIETLYVLPDARGVGLGEALMEDVLAWAAGVGAVAVDSVALPGDRVTKNFFERFGLTARALQVHRRLAPDPGGNPE